MPIAELLGVQIDMHLLLKLSLSVAAVLLGSWAYRFYSSRSRRRNQLSIDDKDPGKCRNCKTTLRGQSSPNQDTDEGGEDSELLHNDLDTFDEDEEPIPLCDDHDTYGEGEESVPLHKDHDTDEEGKESTPSCKDLDTDLKSEVLKTLCKGLDAYDESEEFVLLDGDHCTDDEGEESIPLCEDLDDCDGVEETNDLGIDVGEVSEVFHRNFKTYDEAEELKPSQNDSDTFDGVEESKLLCQSLPTFNEEPLHQDHDTDEDEESVPLCEDLDTYDGGEDSEHLHKDSETFDEHGGSLHKVDDGEESLSLCNDLDVCEDSEESVPLCKDLDTYEEGEESVSLCKDSDDLTSASEASLYPSEQSQDAFSVLSSDQNINMKEDMLTLQKPAEDATRNISFGTALNLPDPTESGMASATGRRSPCFLQKLEGSVGVGRELRQDLERQGAYSSFLSKAEIKVEDANVVLEGKEDPLVRGKIYDYYVESSSHSVTDSNAVPGQFERDYESQPGELRGAESPSALSPIIMRDLVVPLNAAEDPQQSPEPQHPARPALLRKESYLSAAEQSELPVPSLTSGSSSRMTHSLTSASNESITVYHMILSSTEKDGREAGELETVAGAPFLHLPAVEGADLESLKSKLDLGNCLETLCLAKKHGHDAVQQAVLGVMSDNYLQVLMDPNLYGRLMAGEREQIRKQRMKGRKYLMVADMDPQDWAGGQAADTEQRRTSSAVYCYDDYKDAWHTLCPIPQEVISKACAMCTMDNYLFVAVGCQGTDREMTPSKRVFCYNPLTSIWKEISPMNEARPRCKLAALEGYIYAIGGECLSSVERYDPRLDRWTFVAPLPNDTFAIAHHVTVCNGELFVSGGTLRYMLLRYSPKTNTWKQSLMVASKDRTADMVAVGRFLYRFDVNPRLGIGVYRFHSGARLWYECSSRRIQHCPAFQCVTVDDTVYCVSRQFTMQFRADDVSPAFIDEDFSVLSAAKGILFPFVLSLPDKTPRQTSV